MLREIAVMSLSQSVVSQVYMNLRLQFSDNTHYIIGQFVNLSFLLFTPTELFVLPNIIFLVYLKLLLSGVFYPIVRKL